MNKKREAKTESARVVGDGKVDTREEIKGLPVRPNRISKVARSFIESLSRFVNTESPTIEELEENSGMSAGEIMARVNSHT